MACAVHSNVGLMHATMAIFNAWCDRMPMVIMGATGPVDAAIRRPWIDWIHTSRDQAAMIRQYVKFDDLPGSPAAARESLVRAKWISETAPKGPVYINLDVTLQESPLPADLPPFDVNRFAPTMQLGPSAQQVEQVAALVRKSKNIVIAAEKGGKLKTAAQMTSIILLLLPGGIGSVDFYDVGIILMYIALILALVSGVQYTTSFWRQIQ